MKFTSIPLKKPIKILSDLVINKIAAGEVIERPASVIKELVENSIDAGSTIISIEIEGAGTKLLKVKDNGCGMTKDEAVLALQRHATSKISSLDDIFSIDSYGFRGEGLPAIASVSLFELISKTSTDETGVHITSEGGKQQKVREIGVPQGTTMIVKQLFFNTPARLKFLKSSSTELSHIMQVVTLYSLAYPGIIFDVKVDGRQVLKTTNVALLKDRIAQIYGKDFAEQMTDLTNPGHGEQNKTGLQALTGAIGKPPLSRANRQQQIFFVNRRPIESKSLSHALLQGYRTLLMTGRYPVGFLFLEIDPSLVDINVHPAKKEVRFKDDQGIYRSVSAAIQQTLSQNIVTPEITKRVIGQIPDRDKIYTFTKGDDGSSLSENLFHSRQVSLAKDPSPLYKKTEPSSTTRQSLPFLRILGQFNQTFILAENDEGLWVVDQHAAHERVLYEQILECFEKKSLSSQILLLPINIELSPAQESSVQGNQNFLVKLGFEISPLGNRTHCLQAVPSMLIEKDVKKFLMDFLENILDKPQCPTTSEFLERALFYMACRASVMAGDRLTHEQIKALLQALSATRHPFACSHGRPTMIKITVVEMEKWFKRT